MNSEQLAVNSEQLAVNSPPAVHFSLFTAYCLLLLLLLPGFALRLYALESQSIWWDEGISLYLSRLSLAAILADRVINIHPPLYFIILKGWTTLVGAQAFSGRYFSALASLLQIAAVYAVCRRWFRSRNLYAVISQPMAAHRLWPTDYRLPTTDYAPLLAAFLVAISPLSIIYAQETRVYALLPLASMTLLALTWEIVDGRRGHYGRDWLIFGLVEWVGVHLHYVMIFVVAYVSAWLLLALRRARPKAVWRSFWVTQLVVGLACLPWFAAVLSNWTAVQAEANSGAYLADPVPMDFLLRQVWVFHHTGLAGALAQPGIWPLAWVVLLTTAALTLLRLVQLPGPKSDHRLPLTDYPLRRTTTRLLLQWCLPLAAALLVWTVRSFSHPRYIAFAALSYIPLAAYLIVPGAADYRRPLRRAGQVVAICLFASLVALSFLGLHRYFFDPQSAKDDMRGAAQYLAESLAPDDLIIIPDGGWAFLFEYNGRTPIDYPGLNDRQTFGARLAEWTREPRRIALLTDAASSRDWQQVVPFALEQAGSLLETRPFNGLVVRIYEIARPAAPPEWTPLQAHFGSMQLTDGWVEQGAAANTAVSLALRWLLPAATTDRYHLVLNLTDGDGLPLAQQNELLVDAHGRPTEYWPPGAVVTTTHLLPLPPGTPPLSVTLRLGVAKSGSGGQVETVEMTDEAGRPQGIFVNWPTAVTLAPATHPGANPYARPPGLPRLPEPLAVAEGVWLTAVGQDRKEISGGQRLQISLEWQATHVPLAGEQPRLELVQGGELLAEMPLTRHYPLSQWRAGELVLEHTLLPIPAAAEAGPAELFLALAGQRFPIGQVEIVASNHNFTPPTPMHTLDVPFSEVARLVGFDLPQQTVSAGDPIPLTLYWQAMGDDSPVAYTVFAHLLAADGRLIGQHDAPPDNGQRPTTGWIAGEFITDGHEITFREPAYTGPAQIAIGLYNPITSTRLPLADGADMLLLPVAIMVENEP